MEHIEIVEGRILRGQSRFAGAWRGVVVVGLALGIAGCQGGDSPAIDRADTARPAPATAAPVATSPATAAPFDVNDVVARARARFAPRGTEFVAMSNRTRMEVAPTGRLSVTPRGRPTPLSFETVGIARDGAVAAVAPTRAPQIQDDGSLSIARGAIVERFRGGARGIEQSWAFAAQPAGTGDLVVRVRPSETAQVTTATDGLELAGPPGQPAIRYSNATWIDANGQRLAVASRFEDGEIVMRVPAETVGSAAYPAVLDPWVGPSIDLSATLDQFTPGVAGNGANQYLVAFDADTCGDGCDQIQAIRVTVSSTTGVATLDPGGVFNVSGSLGGFVERVRVAYTSGVDRYLVVWTRNNFTTTMVEGAAVNALPSMMTPAAGATSAISDGVGPGNDVDIASNGTRFVVVWQDNETTLETDSIHGRGITVTGALAMTLSPPADDAIISDGPNNEGEVEPSIAWDGLRFLVVWSDSRDGTEDDIFGNSVSIVSGVPTRTAADFEVSHDDTDSQSEPTIGCTVGGTAATRHCVIAWSDYRNRATGDLDVYATHILGSSLDAADVPVATGTNYQYEPQAAASFDGSSVGILWHDDATFRTRVRFVNPATLALFSTEHSFPDAGSNMDLASSAAGQFLAARGDRNIVGGGLPPFNDDFVNVLLALPNGAACPASLPTTGVPAGSAPSEACLSHNCADGFCCNNACAGGPCDTCAGGSSSTQPAGTCGFITAASATTCRPGSTDGICDPTERCDGAQALCPMDVVQPSTFACRAAPMGATCDATENCTGVMLANCPADGVRPMNEVCRAGSGDSCDPDEVCNGSSPACPTQFFEPNTTVCRGAAAAPTCDVAESCPGVAGGACPANGFAAMGAPCRVGSGDACDPTETCPGGSAACPPQVLQNSSFVCRAGSGDSCNPAENCTGTAGVACPMDSFATGTTVCRAGSGDSCNPAENCPGTGGAGLGACPADSFASGATACRVGSGDLCNPTENCPGTGGAGLGACPADSFASAATICRAGSGDLCNAAENCPGTGGVGTSACPADVFENATTVCRASGGECDVPELCPGSGGAGTGACPRDLLVPVNFVCRISGDACNPEERCNGFGVNCPADVRRPDGTSCDDGLVCNGTRQCGGGLCRPATAPSCDDMNLCTADMCSEPAGCATAMIAGCCNNDGECDDMDVCTRDACTMAGGTCSAPADITDCCVTDDDCDDGTDCTTDTCDVTANRCDHESVPSCCTDASDCRDTNACTSESCDATSGMCTISPTVGCCNTAGDCDDADPCTTDTCTGAGGTCGHTAVASCCRDDSGCDDGDACTADRCDATMNRCVASAVDGCCNDDAECDDGDVCTTDSCASNECTTTDVGGECCNNDGDCDDGDRCTTDACEDDECTHEPIIEGCFDPDAGIDIGDAGIDVDAARNRDASRPGADGGGREVDATAMGTDSGLDEVDDSSCGCRVPGDRSTGRARHAWLVVLLLPIAWVVRRRRRR